MIINNTVSGKLITIVIAITTKNVIDCSQLGVILDIRSHIIKELFKH